MIERVYFVTYTTGISNGTNLIGSLVVTSKSWFQQHNKTFCHAVDFIKENHKAVITNFTQI